MHVGEAPSTQVPGCLRFSHTQAEMLERETLAASKALQLRHEAQAATEAKNSRVRNSVFWVSFWLMLMASGIQTKKPFLLCFSIQFLDPVEPEPDLQGGTCEAGYEFQRCQPHTEYPAPWGCVIGCCQLWSMEGSTLKS